MENINQFIGKVDFDYWNNKRISILKILIDRNSVDDVRTLSAISGHAYAWTHSIVSEFVERGICIRDGRMVKLADNWEKRFLSH